MSDEDSIIKLEFLSKKSELFIDKQMNTYRQKQSNIATIISILALFIPFFLGGINNSFLSIKIISIIPVSLILVAITSLLNILLGKNMSHGFNVKKIDELVNKDLKSILIYELGANKSSYEDNIKVLKKIDDKYKNAIKITVIAVVLSSVLLLINVYIKPDLDPTKIEIINKK